MIPDYRAQLRPGLGLRTLVPQLYERGDGRGLHMGIACRVCGAIICPPPGRWEGREIDNPLAQFYTEHEHEAR